MHIQPECLSLSFLLQEEVVRQVLQQIDSHQNGMTQTIRSVRTPSQGCFCIGLLLHTLKPHTCTLSSCSQVLFGSARPAAHSTEQLPDISRVQTYGVHHSMVVCVLYVIACSDMNQLQQQQGQDTDDPVDWQQHPEHAGAIVVHHETILKLKRILLTYM